MSSPSELPVTRGEFEDAITRISNKIDEINRSKQVSWQLVVAVIALLGGAVGFGVKNLSDVSTLVAVATVHTSAIDDFRGRIGGLETDVKGNTTRITINTGVIDDFRERIRGLESNLQGVAIENETQHKWLADTFNQETQHLDTLMHIVADNPGVKLPERRYWPLNHFGEGYEMNGKKH